MFSGKSKIQKAEFNFYNRKLFSEILPNNTFFIFIMRMWHDFLICHINGPTNSNIRSRKIKYIPFSIKYDCGVSKT